MKKIIIVLGLLLSYTINAQESYSFSLQEAIDFAIQNNRAAKNASRDIEVAKKQKWEATATGLPQINGNIDYNNWLKQQISLIPAEFFGGNPGEFAEVAFGTQQTMNATVTLSQKIFDGSYIVGLQSAKVYLDISEFAKEKTDLEVRQSVINAYGNVLLAEESLNILKNNISVVEKNLFETTKIFENGLEEEESVEQLQITLTGLKSYQNNTRRLKVLSYKMLNIVLGLDLETNTTITDNLEALTSQNIVLTLLDSEQDVENTIDYKIADNDKLLQELLYKLQKSKSLPTIDAFINGGYSGNSNNFDFLKSKQDWFGSSMFGVSMKIPIFSSLERSAATQRARINLEKSEENLKEIEQQLLFQITSAKSEYQFAIEDYENKKQNLDLAERIEKKNETKFFEGIGSSFELRQAQTQLYSSQQDYLQAMLDVINAKTNLETILNDISNN